MKSIRCVLGKVLNDLKNRREERVLAKLEEYLSANPNMSEEAHSELIRKFWTHVCYYVEEYSHAEIEEHAIAVSTEKEKITGNSDLYIWWYITTYFFEIFMWKITNFLKG